MRRSALTTLRSAPRGGWLGPVICLVAGALGVLIALALGRGAVASLTIIAVALAMCSALLAEQVFRITASVKEVTNKANAAEQVIEHAYNAFVAMDAAGRIRTWNASAESIFGWSRREAVRRDLADLIVPPQHRDAHRAGLKHYMETGNGPALNKRIEITAVHRIGREFPVELAIWPVREEDGSVSFNAFIADISDRTRMEQDRADLAESLRALLETSREGIFEVDRAGRCTFMNASASAFLGIDPSQIVGKDACAVIHRSEDQASHDERSCVIRHVLHTKKPARYDNDRFWRPDGSSFAAECRTHPTLIRGELEGAVVVFTPDTTGRLPYEAETDLGITDDDSTTNLHVPAEGRR